MFGSTMLRGKGVIWNLTCVVALVAAGCTIFVEPACPDSSPTTTVDVSGVYRYTPTGLINLSGTITFEQDGDTVRVVDTTYDFGGNRRLEGTAQIEGNRLEIELVPINGDTDYRADVIIVFSDDGDRFCVEFSDTNGDVGSYGSFIGLRQ